MINNGINYCFLFNKFQVYLRLYNSNIIRTFAKLFFNYFFFNYARKKNSIKQQIKRAIRTATNKMNYTVISYLFLFSRFFFNIDAAHFNGGSIRWIPVNPYDNSSSITITVIQSYWWVYPTVSCNSYVPLSTAPSSYSSYNLNCIANCSTDGGYSSSNKINYITDCVSISQPLGMIMSERAVNLTLTDGAYFYLAFQSSAWRTLNYPLSTALSWSIPVLINLQRHSNGHINTPPTARVASPQFVIVNTPVQIPIVIEDINEGDDVRCRWSQKPTAVPVDECGGVCFPASMPSGTTLSNCTLFFQGFTVGVWYAAAMQVQYLT